MSEERLHGANINATFQQMRCKTVAKGVTASLFGDARCSHRTLDLPLKGVFMEVVAGDPSGSRVRTKRRRRENVLPCPFLRCVRILSPQRFRQMNFANARVEILSMALPERG